MPSDLALAKSTSTARQTESIAHSKNAQTCHFWTLRSGCLLKQLYFATSSKVVNTMNLGDVLNNGKNGSVQAGSVEGHSNNSAALLNGSPMEVFTVGITRTKDWPLHNQDGQ
ncbi:hypothetical protein ElyMa_002115800 [Elysia marginata]|uniref:Uncharacterized protein n=1 Tax=Elysia marginata TaxID=1093978 RepID=A0AAV4FHZ9_9GAST|nr:hypothetical protein ElyMa_002115800 [Elysia marginata]